MKQLREQRQQFYLVVYTQTDAQTGNYYCGSGLDLGLNEAGIEEGRKLARRFKKNPLKIKRIIASPELRSIQMADVMHDEIKAKLSLVRDFADQFLGDLEGKPMPKPNGHGALAVEDPVADPPRGESADAFSARVNNGLVKILQEPGVLLLVTHPRVARAVYKMIGIGSEVITPGILYAIDIPAGEGIAHAREI
ncbi:MAG: histidine phosphatase family protein [Bdellovibrionales bacterium]|nr:histidine phosphatase family protein [Bdellovibrionales bacterium]